MNTGALYRVTRGDDGPAPRGGDAMRQHAAGSTPASVALWVFMGVVTSLFSLFIVAFGLRMDSIDWHRIALPWQVWLSTGLLIAGSVAMWRASRAAQAGEPEEAGRALALGGIGALGFVASQLWAWQALGAADILPANNPAGSFFYMLTGMHGLHMVGGLVAWIAAWQGIRGSARPGAALRVRLLARYWHFMLAVWLVLLAALGWLTPEIVRYICGTD
ncbi:cytochrome c oxidase subunit 3 [Cupriavidus gilardii]|uniref:cytochrome c oxidase subunit 3 n=1 Tax=Cupriavidus gilardii TaxID=82541 RepID=UPI001ABE2AEA|nr:cytochrome c oxidase subunit 3 [Cupriavidus gilardii]MBO4122267.1 cytochrome c oxidase subunit 3 [Cupriavidus gilardii]